jgi:hypothetical protein
MKVLCELDGNFFLERRRCPIKPVTEDGASLIAQDRLKGGN